MSLDVSKKLVGIRYRFQSHFFLFFILLDPFSLWHKNQYRKFYF
ncbi:hypothetical protein LEP1GSC049_0024 [Leptospira kirschneri serovar Cynopteri str. 3522 CT]|nr:hypothetical protein LEP1GSC049_0024 [Leptospira kirschneri serovar Cynopteri str. 3522 CT]